MRKTLSTLALTLAALGAPLVGVAHADGPLPKAVTDRTTPVVNTVCQPQATVHYVCETVDASSWA